MKKWFVQYNPTKYDVVSAARDPDLKFLDLWATKGKTRLRANAHELKEGDLCLFVQSGVNKGIVGYGVVKERAHTRKITKEFSRHFLNEEERIKWSPNTVRDVIEISYEKIFRNQINFRDIEKESDYQEEFLGSLLRMPRGTFYKIPTVGWQFLKKRLYKELDIPVENNIDDFVEELKNIHQLSELDVPKLTEEPIATIVVSKQKVRHLAFSQKIKEMYRFQCAICGKERYSKTGRPEVEAAHIYPKAKDGTDDFRNGLALCKLHHWAFDSGLVAITNNHRIIVKEEIKENEDYKEIYEYENKCILFPENNDYRPHPLFLKAHREEVFNG